MYGAEGKVITFVHHFFKINPVSILSKISTTLIKEKVKQRLKNNKEMTLNLFQVSAAIWSLEATNHAKESA